MYVGECIPCGYCAVTLNFSQLNNIHLSMFFNRVSRGIILKTVCAAPGESHQKSDIDHFKIRNVSKSSD